MALQSHSDDKKPFVAVVGSRDFPERWMVEAAINRLPAGITVVSGGARGVDRWAREFAEARGLAVEEIKAEWDKYGKKAGMIRNKPIVDRSDYVIAFLHNNSKGTRNTIQHAINAGKEVIIYYGNGYSAVRVLPKISEFRDNYYFLSNMYPCKVVIGEYECTSSEMAYQLCKATNDHDRQYILSAKDGIEARERGRQIAVRTGFDQASVKVSVMRSIVEAKFRQNPELYEKLVNTGNLQLIEGCTEDTFWGMPNNHLGKILMSVRSGLLEDYSAAAPDVLSGSILFVDADIFDVEGMWVCPVNLRLTMGAGLAKAMAKRIKGLILAYDKAFMDGLLDIGKPCIIDLPSGYQVMCFATKNDWRYPSHVSYIESGLQYIAENRLWVESKPLVFPALGCGLGQLDWETQVKPLFRKYLSDVPVPIYVLNPREGDSENSPSDHQMSLEFSN